MHRALTAMGGLPRRAPASSTIALLTPPAPPQSGSANAKKASAQGAAAGHKCSRCKSRPKSGSGSSLCIRCKLQRDYGSPRGGFAAPRKKLPAHPPTTTATSTSQHNVAPAQSGASSMTTTSTHPSSNQSSAAGISGSTTSSNDEHPSKSSSSAKRRTSIGTVRLKVDGEKPIKVSTASLRQRRNLTETNWPSLKVELENEREDFLPEDLNRTLEVDFRDNRGPAVNVDLPADIMGAMDTRGNGAPRVEMSRAPPVVSLPEPVDDEDDDDFKDIASPQSDSDNTQPDLLDDARQTVKLYGQHLSAALDALHNSTSQNKWVSVLSVYQKKAVLAKILTRLGQLERLLLPPEERIIVSRISRSVETLFNSMNHLRGQMQQTASSGGLSSGGRSSSINSEQRGPSSSCSVSPFSSVASPSTTSPPVYQQQQQQQQEPQCSQQPIYFSNVTVETPVPVQSTRSLKDEADEEITKILAKLQSEDRAGPSQSTTMIFDDSKLNVGSTERIYSSAYTAGMQPNNAPYGFLASYAPANNDQRGACQYDQQQIGQMHWAQTTSSESSVNRVVLNSAGANMVHNSLPDNDQFSPPATKRAFIDGSQISSGSMVSAPQLRNLLARKVTPLPTANKLSTCFYGPDRLNHAQEPTFTPTNNNLEKTQPNQNSINPAIQQQQQPPAFSPATTNNYSAVYTNGQVAQYPVPASHNTATGHGASMDTVGGGQANECQSNVVFGNQQPMDQVISEPFSQSQWTNSSLGGVFN